MAGEAAVLVRTLRSPPEDEPGAFWSACFMCIDDSNSDADGGPLLLLSNKRHHRVSVHSLLDGRFVRYLGDAKHAATGESGDPSVPGQLRQPTGVCVDGDD